MPGGYLPPDQKDNGGCLCVDAKMDLSLMFFSLGLTNRLLKFFLYIFTKGRYINKYKRYAYSIPIRGFSLPVMYICKQYLLKCFI